MPLTRPHSPRWWQTAREVPWAALYNLGNVDFARHRAAPGLPIDRETARRTPTPKHSSLVSSSYDEEEEDDDEVHPPSCILILARCDA